MDRISHLDSPAVRWRMVLRVARLNAPTRHHLCAYPCRSSPFSPLPHALCWTNSVVGFGHSVPRARARTRSHPTRTHAAAITPCHHPAYFSARILPRCTRFAPPPHMVGCCGVRYWQYLSGGRFSVVGFCGAARRFSLILSFYIGGSSHLPFLPTPRRQPCTTRGSRTRLAVPLSNDSRLYCRLSCLPIYMPPLPFYPSTYSYS